MGAAAGHPSYPLILNLLKDEYPATTLTPNSALAHLPRRG